MTPEEFQGRFPAIAADEYPDAAVQVRITLAEKFFAKDVWTDDVVREHCIGLHVAHFLTAGGSRAAGGAGSGGAVMGVVSSKSVDGASVSYDTSSSIEQGAGFWNATPYGRELRMLLRVFGAGAVQL